MAKYNKIFLRLASASLLFISVVMKAEAQAQYMPPSTPSIVDTPQAQIKFLVEHYWDNLNMGDEKLINDEKYIEQAFASYCYILLNSNSEEQVKSINKLLAKAQNGSVSTYLQFIEMAEKYLYEAESPMRNDEVYIHFAQHLINNDAIENIYKQRPQYQLKFLLRNRVAQPASNFEFKLNDTQIKTLYDIKSPFTILLFEDKGCEYCRYVNNLLINNQMLIESKQIKILSINISKQNDTEPTTKNSSIWIQASSDDEYVNKIYDLRAIPTIYLLDREKKVILKDCNIEYLLEFILRM